MSSTANTGTAPGNVPRIEKVARTCKSNPNARFSPSQRPYTGPGQRDETGLAEHELEPRTEG